MLETTALEESLVFMDHTLIYQIPYKSLVEDAMKFASVASVKIPLWLERYLPNCV